MTLDPIVGYALIGLAVAGWVFLVVLTGVIVAQARDRPEDWWEVE